MRTRGNEAAETQSGVKQILFDESDDSSESSTEQMMYAMSSVVVDKPAEPAQTLPKQIKFNFQGKFGYGTSLADIAAQSTPSVPSHQGESTVCFLSIDPATLPPNFLK